MNFRLLIKMTLSISLILLFILSLNTLITSSIHNTEDYTISDDPIILKPSLVNPVIIQAGSSFEILVKNPIEGETPTVLIYDGFISYSSVVQDITDYSDNVVGYIIATDGRAIPSLYNIKIIYSSAVVTTSNAIKITAEEPSNNITFIHWTDTHLEMTNDRIWQLKTLINEINLLRPDFTLLTGDLVEGLVNPRENNTGNEQFPLMIELLKELKVPTLICDGNHDFQSNDYQDGVALWEKYFLPIDHVVKFEYADTIFVGVSTTDTNGIPSNQLNEAKNILQSSDASLKFFFTHSDYDNNQLPQFYSSTGITASFLGHDHHESINQIGDTVEIITDNSLTLLPGDPGHYRILTVENSSFDYSLPQIESTRLFSEILEASNEGSNNSLTIRGKVNNTNINFNYSEITDEIIVKGLWRPEESVNLSKVDYYQNGTHTRVIIGISDIGFGLTSYKIELTEYEATTSFSITETLPLGSNDSMCSISNDTSTSSIKTTSYSFSLFTVLLAAFILHKKNQKGKKNN